jgi:hypothetical protein|tara:strand:+ start:106 stop:579 length:474 start_codon:yes stop_codon:yes gene_type:complete
MSWKKVLKQELYNINLTDWGEHIEEVIEGHYESEPNAFYLEGKRKKLFDRMYKPTVKVTKLGGRKLEATVVLSDFEYSRDFINANEEGTLPMGKIEFTISATYPNTIETKRTKPKVQFGLGYPSFFNPADKRILEQTLSFKKNGGLGETLDLMLDSY